MSFWLAVEASPSTETSAPAPPEPLSAPQSAPVVEAGPPEPTLSPRMRKALDYTARRYRLSAAALAPAFAAAERAGRQLGIDPLLIVAVIGVESGFNPLAESVMGAQGLMQVIPRYHADKLPPPLRGAELALFDPAVNVRIGTQVLHEYIRAHGDLVGGLQQFAGAADDPDEAYADKVLGEFERLEAVTRNPGRTAAAARAADAA